MKGIVVSLVLLALLAGAAVLGGAMLLGETPQETESELILTQNIAWSDDCQHRCEDGICNVIIGRTMRVRDTDGECKPIEDAEELTGSFEWVYLEQDPNYEIEVEGYNYTTIKKLKIKSEVGGYIEFKINDTLYTTPYFEEGEEIELENIEVDNIFAYNFTFGNASTTIQLQDADTENLENVHLRSGSPDTNYEGNDRLYVGYHTAGSVLQFRTYNKFNISSIPSGQQIDDAKYFVYSDTGSGSGPSEGINIHHSTNQTWTEDSLIWNTQPSFNPIVEDTNNTPTSIWTKWYNFTVTEAVSGDYDDERKTTTFMMKAVTEPDSANNYISFRSKEYTDTTQRPYLNITYSEADSTPTDITFLFPTPDNDTNLTQDNYFVNVSISEAADTVFLELTNTSGTINYTMTNEAGNWYNFNTSHSNNMTYFFVYANDTAGNLNRSLERFVNISVSAPPADNTTFNMTLPLQVPIQSSPAGPATQPIEINFSTKIGAGINASVVSGIPQNNTYAIFEFKNAGNVNLKWIIELNEPTPSCIKLNGSWDSAGSSVFNLNATTNATVNTSIAANEVEKVWVFGDALDCTVNDNVAITITHYSQKA